MASAASAEVAYGETIYGSFSVSETVSLGIASLVITLVASLYPAWFAARMEPIDALRAL
jgi:ABC-type antimicrobial peptide transport system permease subunit